MYWFYRRWAYRRGRRVCMSEAILLQVLCGCIEHLPYPVNQCYRSVIPMLLDQEILS